MTIVLAILLFGSVAANAFLFALWSAAHAALMETLDETPGRKRAFEELVKANQTKEG